MHEILENILIGLAAVGGIGGLAALAKSSVAFIRPGEVGVKVNRFTGNTRVLLASEREERRIITSVSDRTPAIRLADGSFQPISRDLLRQIKTDPIVRQQVRQQLNIPQGQGLKVMAVSTPEHTEIVSRQVEKPKTGLIFKFPLITQLAVLDTTDVNADPTEEGVQVPMKYNGHPVQATPDIRISFALEPSSADQVVKRFTSQAEFNKAVIAHSKSALVEATQGVDITQASPETISDKAETAFADRLSHVGLASMVSVRGVEFQGVSLAGNLADDLNRLTGQELRRKALGSDFAAIEQAGILARGPSSSTVVMPAASKDQAPVPILVNPK